MLSGIHFNPISYPTYIIMVYRALFVHLWTTSECVLFIQFVCPFQHLCDALSLCIIEGQERLNSLLFQVDYLTYSGPVLLNPAHEKLRTINLFHYHSVCSFCHTVLFISAFPIDCTVIQILNIGCKSRVEERSLMSYKRDIMVLCIAFVLFAAASWCQKHYRSQCDNILFHFILVLNNVSELSKTVVSIKLMFPLLNWQIPYTGNHFYTFSNNTHKHVSQFPFPFVPSVAINHPFIVRFLGLIKCFVVSYCNALWHSI